MYIVLFPYFRYQLDPSSMTAPSSAQEFAKKFDYLSIILSHLHLLILLWAEKGLVAFYTTVQSIKIIHTKSILLKKWKQLLWVSAFSPMQFCLLCTVARPYCEPCLISWVFRDFISVLSMNVSKKGSLLNLISWTFFFVFVCFLNMVTVWTCVDC